MISSPAVSFHCSVDLFGEDPVAPFASEIMQRASDRHHLVNHSPPTIAKLVSQNPQSLHRCHRVLNRDPVSRQQAVESAMSPMEATSIAPRPRGDHASAPGVQSLKTAVTQKVDLLGQAQSRSLSHLLIMALAGHGGRAPQNPALAYNEHILDGVAFLAPAVESLLFTSMLRSRQTSLRSIDNQFFQLRLFSQQLVQISGQPSRSMQRNQLSSHRSQLTHPLADLALGDTKEQPHHILSRIGFEIQQDEEQFLFGADQAAFASTARAPLPSGAGRGLGAARRGPSDVKIGRAS